MELYIAGGCGEHGRNAFLLQDGTNSILVDCGIINGKENPYPLLDQKQIKSIKYLFLTHSHEDHVGALKWLLAQGFSGKVVLSEQTYEQIDFEFDNKICLRENEQYKKLEDDLFVEYGKSGHCEGALWYLVNWKGKNVLFSGDYCEYSNIYTCDEVREKKVDLAVLDCAYGLDQMGAIKSKEKLCKEINYWLKKRKNVLLPVPKYGRGLDIIKDLLQTDEVRFVIDECLLQQCKTSNKFDQKEIERIIKFRGEIVEGCHVYLISDPQLKKVENKRFASKIIMRKDKIILTGNIDEKSYSEMIYNAGAALKKNYYVHQNVYEVRGLVEKNRFERVVLAHTKERFEKKKLEDYFLILASGERYVL